MPKNRLMSSKVKGHVYLRNIKLNYYDVLGYMPQKLSSIEVYEGELLIEDECCSIFGCGKILSREEKLFGNKCIKHSK